MYIPYQQIVNQLQLNNNETLLIASDITRLAYTSMKNGENFKAELFVDSFKEKLTHGTLLFPAFNDSLLSEAVFDLQITPPQTGLLSNVVFKRKDFKRTKDPLHSFLVTGKFSDDLLKINNSSTFGSDSVFAFLKERKALMLLIDIDLDHSFTFAHYVEEQENVNYRKFKKINVKYIDEGVEQQKVMNVFSKKNGVVNTLNKLQKLFVDNGVMTITEINNSIFSIVKLDQAYMHIQNDIRQNNGKSIHEFNFMNFVRSAAKSIIR